MHGQGVMTNYNGKIDSGTFIDGKFCLYEFPLYKDACIWAYVPLDYEIKKRGMYISFSILILSSR